MAITDYHRLIFDYLEEFRNKNPDQNFTYLLRAKNSTKRPKTKYLFTGDGEKYILVGIYLPNNGHTKTRSIGLLFEYDKEEDTLFRISLEVVYDDPKLKSDYPLYEAILSRIGNEKFKKFAEKRYSLIYSSLDWKESIDNFLTHERPLINEVIKEYKRESSFTIPPETLAESIEYLRQNTPNQYWKYTAQNSDDWKKIFNNQVIGLNYNNPSIPDLTPFKSLLELENTLGTVGKSLTYLAHFMSFKDAKIGEVVFASPNRTTVSAIGIISGPYHYNQSGQFEHSRSVDWLTNKSWEYISNSINGYATAFANDPFCYAAIGPKILEEYVRSHPEYKSLFEEKGLIKSLTNNITASKPLTIYPKNTILYGPPGTGKTYTTIDLAVEIADGQKNAEHKINKKRFDELLGSQIEFITFHQNYTYEDFVTGIKPALNDAENGLRFSRHEGIFYKLAKRARENFENSNQGTSLSYVLVIDEINRANMSRVFGELITLLEEDKRLGAENELQVMLPSGELFGVPPNLYLIGTMNTADKSLALLDIALRRRFEFKGMYPKYDLPGMDPEAAAILQKLNKALYDSKKSADFLIGHAYFLNKKKGALKGTFENRVIPLLMEYFSGRTDLVEKVLQEAGIRTKTCEFTYQLMVDDNTL